MQDTDFAKLAGNAAKADGIEPGSPMFNLEQKVTRSLIAGLADRYGMMVKVGKQYFHQPLGLPGALGGLFQKGSMAVGGVVEDVYLKDGAPIKSTDGTLFPRLQQEAVGELSAVNFRYKIGFSVKEYDARKGMLNAEAIGSWDAMQLAGPMKTRDRALYTAYKEIVGNVTPGKRAYSSTTSSDGTGSSVTVTSFDANNYVNADNIDTLDVGLSPLSNDKVKIEGGIGQVLDIVHAVGDMVEKLRERDSAKNTLLGVSDYLQGTPNIIMEGRVVNAMTEALRRASGNGAFGPVPTTTAKGMLGEFGNLVTVDAFPSLPTKTDYEDLRLVAVIADPRSFSEEETIPETLRAQPLVDYLETSFALHGERAIRARGGVPAGAILCPDEFTEPVGEGGDGGE